MEGSAECAKTYCGRISSRYENAGDLPNEEPGEEQATAAAPLSDEAPGKERAKSKVARSFTL